MRSDPTTFSQQTPGASSTEMTWPFKLFGLIAHQPHTLNRLLTQAKKSSFSGKKEQVKPFKWCTNTNKCVWKYDYSFINYSKEQMQHIWTKEAKRLHCSYVNSITSKWSFRFMIISYKMPGRLKTSKIFQGSRERILKGLLTNKYASLRFLKAACVIILDSTC